MYISSFNKTTLSFSSAYKSEDILRLITGYPYKNKSTLPDTVKSLTGIDLYSKEFHKQIKDDSEYLIAVSSIQQACADEILKQHPQLHTADDSFDCMLHLNEGKKAQDLWFKEQLKKLPEVIEIEPFKLSLSLLREKYDYIMSIFQKIF